MIGARTAKRVLTFLGILGAAVVALLALFWGFQRRLIYLPSTAPPPPVASLLPGGEEVAFDTNDGIRLGGWYVPAEAGEARALVLVFNGNAGHRAFRAPLAAALSRRGFSVLLFDYRGYGGNSGRPSEDGLLADARAARGYLDSRRTGDSLPVFYFGESLGAGVAVALAVDRPPRGLILRSPFTSLVDAGRRHYPFLPVGLLLRDRYPSVERIRHIGCPLLVVAGTRDRIVPIAQSRALHEAAATEQKRFVLIEGAGHNDFDLLAGEVLIREVVSFIDESLANAA